MVARDSSVCAPSELIFVIVPRSAIADSRLLAWRGDGAARCAAPSIEQTYAVCVRRSLPAIAAIPRSPAMDARKIHGMADVPSSAIGAFRDAASASGLELGSP